MRVVCNSVDDFITNLKAQIGTAIFEQTVWASVTRNPLGKENQREAVRFSVVYQASVVVNTNDGGQYLLEVGEDCGIDYEDATQDRSGTKRAQELIEKVQGCCDKRGLKVRPGIVSI